MYSGKKSFSLMSNLISFQQQIIEVAHANTALTEERDKLKNKIESLSTDESKRYPPQLLREYSKL